MIIEGAGAKLFGPRAIVSIHGNGPFRLRREHLPERALRGALQRGGSDRLARGKRRRSSHCDNQSTRSGAVARNWDRARAEEAPLDRKSTRLNSSHEWI